MVDQDKRKQLPEPLLKADTDGGANRHPWRREAIYRSSICIAVHLTVHGTPVTDAEEVKEAQSRLFVYLRQIAQVFLDFGEILPLAAVVGTKGRPKDCQLTRAIAAWGSDQAWHRGGFSLFVEDTDEDVRQRLQDLLSPVAEAMYTPQSDVTRDQAWFADQLEDLANSPDSVLREPMVAELARLCAQRLRTKPDGTDDLDSFPALTDWQRTLLAKARDMAEGRLTK